MGKEEGELGDQEMGEEEREVIGEKADEEVDG